MQISETFGEGNYPALAHERLWNASQHVLAPAPVAGPAGRLVGRLAQPEERTMTWYHVQDGAPKGPLQQPEFETLASEGTIEARTLVWQEGVADWQPYAEVAAPAQANSSMAS
jgi:hypothetical protein